MDQMWAKYYEEQWGRKTHVVEDVGFVCYSISGDEFYIVDMYIVPEKRERGQATKLANEISKIALTHGCKFLTTTVPLKQNNPERSINAVLSYGFKYHHSSGDYLAFIKNLEA